jgi:5-methylcytosine-specific restriction endonuclease McrBC regulatory subunit McrC
MEWVFQRYLLHALQDKLPAAGAFRYTDASGHNAHALFSAPVDRVNVPLKVDLRANAEPDFVLHRDGGPVLVADAKYKTDRGRDDVYQVVSHALAYSIRVAVLIYPTRAAKEDPSLICIGDVGTVRVYEGRYPLDASNLGAAASWVAGELVKLVDIRNEGALSARVVS